jgi:hypothetical protein
MNRKPAYGLPPPDQGTLEPLKIFGKSRLLKFPFLLPALCALLSVAVSAGCAISYQNGDRRTLLGFTWVEYRTSGVSEKTPAIIKIGKEPIREVAPLVQQKTLGFYLDVTRHSPGFGLGYRDVIVVVPEENAVTAVDYHTADPLAAKLTVTRTE